jgi:anaerobic selenocysteine-containing dehydrogenase
MPKTTKASSRDEVAVAELVDGPVFEPYESPAGGWGTLHATAKALREQSIEMTTFGSTRIASEYCQVRIGDDVAALKGVMKIMLDAHDEARPGGRTPVFEVKFIEQHTQGFEALAADLNKSFARAPRILWASENIKTSGTSRQER